MTYYNIEKLEALKEEFHDKMIANEDLSEKDTRLWNDGVYFFIQFLKQKEKASFFDPNQLEIPFPDEDNSK